MNMNSQSQTNFLGHNRNHSLADFDPFSPVTPERKSNPSTPSTSSPHDDLMDVVMDLQKDSPRVATLGRHASFSFSPLRNKIRGSVARTKAASPTNPSIWNKTKSSTVNPLHFFPHLSTNAGRGLTDGANRRRHRKAHSLVENARLWKEVQESVPVEASSVTNSPMAKDRDESETSGKISDLFIPSLAKPRPTSLLREEDDVIRTCEFDPSTFQLTLPEREDVLVAIRTVHFLESYRLHELSMDLSTLGGYSKMELQSFATGSPESCKSLSSCHRALVESLMYCCPDLLEVKGYFRSDDNEVLIIERQKNQFLTVFYVAETRGKTQPLALKDYHNVTIAKAYFEIVHAISPRLFARLDELTEESPFSDFVFAGHGRGAGLAILASYLYAHTRTSQRVSAYLTAAPKVGMEDFRRAVHSQPNLQVIRIDSQSQRGNQNFCHVGHSIRLYQGSGKLWKAKAFKFASDAPAFRSLLYKKQALAEEYVDMIENTKNWPKDFHAEDVGEGVKGENDEKRILT